MNPQRMAQYLDQCRVQVAAAQARNLAGRLTRINGLVMEAAGLKLPLGSGCRIIVPGGNSCEAEVVGFNGDKLFMMPTDDVVWPIKWMQMVVVWIKMMSCITLDRIVRNKADKCISASLPMTRARPWPNPAVTFSTPPTALTCPTRRRP